MLLDQGYPFLINGQERRFRGSIAFASGDNPGIQLLGGFKEGCQPHRKCHHCLGLDEQIKSMVKMLEFFFKKNLKLE